MGRVGSMLQRQLFLDGKHVQSQENISELLLLWLDNSSALLKYGGAKKILLISRRLPRNASQFHSFNLSPSSLMVTYFAYFMPSKRLWNPVFYLSLAVFEVLGRITFQEFKS